MVRKQKALVACLVLSMVFVGCSKKAAHISQHVIV